MGKSNTSQVAKIGALQDQEKSKQAKAVEKQKRIGMRGRGETTYTH